MSLRFSLASNLMAFVAYLLSSKKYPFLQLLRLVVLLGFSDLIVMMGLGLI